MKPTSHSQSLDVRAVLFRGQKAASTAVTVVLSRYPVHQRTSFNVIRFLWILTASVVIRVQLRASCTLAAKTGIGFDWSRVQRFAIVCFEIIGHIVQWSSNVSTQLCLQTNWTKFSAGETDLFCSMTISYHTNANQAKHDTQHYSCNGCYQILSNRADNIRSVLVMLCWLVQLSCVWSRDCTENILFTSTLTALGSVGVCKASIARAATFTRETQQRSSTVSRDANDIVGSIRTASGLKGVSNQCRY